MFTSSSDHVDPRSVVLSPSDVVKAGYVMKQSKHLLQWKRRWLVLTKDMLCSFSTKGALAYPTEALLLRMCSSVKSADEETGQANSFKVDSSSRVFYLIAETPADKEAWIGQIGRQMIRPAGANPEEAEVIKLMCLIPPIEKLDTVLNSLVNVKHLSLSTNCIDKMIPLPGLKNLQILSLGRNQIKKITSLEEVGASLQQLWISYNQISSLDGLTPCVKLHTLYISNNAIASWDEISKLSALPELTNICLVGNPIYEGFTRKSVRPMVTKHFPGVKTLDGEMVT
ncbi:Dynein light chain 1, axonemal, partial [Perkinsus olseni]